MDYNNFVLYHSHTSPPPFPIHYILWYRILPDNWRVSEMQNVTWHHRHPIFTHHTCALLTGHFFFGKYFFSKKCAPSVSSSLEVWIFVYLKQNKKGEPKRVKNVTYIVFLPIFFLAFLCVYLQQNKKRARVKNVTLKLWEVI